MATTGTLLTILSNIPWGQVVENAPKIADGATRLWGAVKGRRSQPGHVDGQTPGEVGATADEAADAPATPASPAEVAARAEALARQLAGEVAALQAAVDELQTQLQASSGLIKDLAEQNTQLVQRLQWQQQRLDRQQQRLRQLVLGAGVAVVLLAAAGITLWLRG